MSRLTRVVGLVGLAGRQLVTDRARTTIAILGVAFAVLSVTLLFGVGFGVVSTGESLLDDSDRDLWVTGGTVEVQPGSVGGFQNPIVDSHELANDMQEHEDVAVASPLALQTVYASADGEEFETIVATGVRQGGTLDYEQGGPFGAGTQQHRANGTYDGPRTNEVIVDPALADRLGVGIGDTIYVGGTLIDAQQTELEIVGLSSTFREFVGSEVVVVPLSELQTMTGNAYDDRATYISIELEDDADPDAVKQDLEQSYPEYDIRTNREQLTTILERQALVIAGGLSLVGLAVIAGMVLSINLFLSLVHQQRRSFAVFRAVGGSRRSALSLAMLQALFIAGAGCVVGFAVTPLLAVGLNRLASAMTGFDGLVQVTATSYLVGAGVAIGFGVLGMAAGVIRLTRNEIVSTVLQ